MLTNAIFFLLGVSLYLLSGIVVYTCMERLTFHRGTSLNHDTVKNVAPLIIPFWPVAIAFVILRRLCKFLYPVCHWFWKICYTAFDRLFSKNVVVPPPPVVVEKFDTAEAFAKAKMRRFHNVNSRWDD